MILTSNRVGAFDAAFTSRIQISLHYPALNKASRETIWRNFFNMVNTDEEDVDMDDLNANIDTLSEFEINGRQIRNSFTTARQLAIFKNQTLCFAHIDQALAAVTDFNSYLKQLHGHLDNDWAHDNGLR